MVIQTGSGFIKAVREGGESGFEIQLPVSHVDVGETQITGYKSNPATNDWVPNLDQHHHQVYKRRLSQQKLHVLDICVS